MIDRAALPGQDAYFTMYQELYRVKAASLVLMTPSIVPGPCASFPRSLLWRAESPLAVVWDRLNRQGLKGNKWGYNRLMIRFFTTPKVCRLYRLALMMLIAWPVTRCAG